MVPVEIVEMATQDDAEIVRGCCADMCNGHLIVFRAKLKTCLRTIVLNDCNKRSTK